MQKQNGKSETSPEKKKRGVQPTFVPPSLTRLGEMKTKLEKTGQVNKAIINGEAVTHMSFLRGIQSVLIRAKRDYKLSDAQIVELMKEYGVDIPMPTFRAFWKDVVKREKSNDVRTPIGEVNPLVPKAAEPISKPLKDQTLVSDPAQKYGGTSGTENGEEGGTGGSLGDGEAHLHKPKYSKPAGGKQ